MRKPSFFHMSYLTSVLVARAVEIIHDQITVRYCKQFYEAMTVYGADFHMAASRQWGPGCLSMISIKLLGNFGITRVSFFRPWMHDHHQVSTMAYVSIEKYSKVDSCVPYMMRLNIPKDHRNAWLPDPYHCRQRS